MKKLFFACLLLLLSLVPPASADAGPKPSVVVNFTGIQDEPFYATLLSSQHSSGPARAWDKISPYENRSHGEAGRPIWEKFLSYQDADHYFFLQEWWDCSETHQLRWSYFPPQKFKILLYFPETDAFYISYPYKQYAFHSYFRVDLSAMEDGPLRAVPVYDAAYFSNLLAFAGRVLLTILLELALAWWMGYREGRHIILFVTVNLITQVILNGMLSLGFRDFYVFLKVYLFAELLVFLLEAVAYAHYLPKISATPQKKSRAVLYAFAANLLSFAGGLAVSLLTPNSFF